MGGHRTADLVQRPKVDVVLVAWNHGAWLARAIHALAGLRAEAFTLDRVFLVDNASAEPVQAPRQTAPAITILRNRSNRGFAAACNQAAWLSRADYLLFLNPDTEIAADALERAVAVLRCPSHADVGIVGLRLTDASGMAHRTCGRFPGLRAFLNQTLGLATLAPHRFRGIRSEDWGHDDTRDVDYVSAAALLIRRPLFDALGGFDERLFLYLEDADLALRARRAGWRTRFCAEAAVTHALGWASGGHRPWRLAQAWRSLIVYGWIHLPVASAVALTGCVTLAAPLARFGQAVVRMSPGLAMDSARAWVLLWPLLAQSLLRGRRATPPGTGLPPAGAQAPPRASST